MNPNDIVPNEIPLPGGPMKKPAKANEPEVRTELTIGSFYAEQRSLVDSRREHLARVGMMPEHTKALAMPDLDVRVEAPAPFLPPEAEKRPGTKYEPRKLPKLPGVNVAAHEEE